MSEWNKIEVFDRAALSDVECWFTVVSNFNSTFAYKQVIAGRWDSYAEQFMETAYYMPIHGKITHYMIRQQKPQPPND